MAFSTIQGSGGAPDSFVGTSGVDTIVLINEAGPLFLGAQGDNDVVQFTTATNTGVGYSLKGGSGDDIIADASPLGTILVTGFVNGNSGADTITAQVNIGTVFGGQGDDTITSALVTSGSRVNGNLNDDVINVFTVVSSSVFGGQGDDALNLNGSISDSVIQGDRDDDIINLTAGANYLESIINGNAGDDIIVENAAAIASLTDTTIFGGAGNDILDLSQGATGADAAAFLSGDDGADTVSGGGNTDTLSGGAGNDILTGGADADRLTGGAGADRFQYNVVGAALVAGGDTITDFVVADGDRISTSVLAATTGFVVGTAAAAGETLITATTAGNNVNFVSGAGVTTALSAQATFIYNTTTGTLLFDADGTGGAAAASTVATLTGAPILSAASFLIA